MLICVGNVFFAKWENQSLSRASGKLCCFILVCLKLFLSRNLHSALCFSQLHYCWIEWGFGNQHKVKVGFVFAFFKGFFTLFSDCSHTFPIEFIAPFSRSCFSAKIKSLSTQFWQTCTLWWLVVSLLLHSHVTQSNCNLLNTIFPQLHYSCGVRSSRSSRKGRVKTTTKWERRKKVSCKVQQCFN